MKKRGTSLLYTAVSLTFSLLLLAGLSGCSGDSSSSTSSQSLSSSNTSSSASSAQTTSSAKELSTEEVAALLEEMLPKGREITGWFSGIGLEGDENAAPLDTANDRKFVPVKNSEIQSIADLKKAVEEIFTKETAQNDFYQFGLEGDFSRYKEINGVLCIDLNQGGANNGYDWQTGSLNILSQTADAIVVEMDYQSAYGETGREKLTLKNTAAGWRIDSRL